MIEYVIAQNPDDRILKKASRLLKSGQLICLPSDTNWILLADPFAKGSIDKLLKIKDENSQKHFSALCRDIKMASSVALIDNSVYRVLNKIVPGNYTFIFEATKRISKTIKASKIDKEIGVRIIPSPLIDKLLEVHGEILLSTQVPRDRIGLELEEEVYSYHLEDPLKSIAAMIIDPGEFEFAGESSVISFLGAVPEVLRAGAGDISIF